MEFGQPERLGRRRPLDFHGSRRTARTEVGPRHGSGGGSCHRSHRETDPGNAPPGRRFGSVALKASGSASDAPLSWLCTAGPLGFGHWSRVTAYSSPTRVRPAETRRRNEKGTSSPRPDPNQDFGLRASIACLITCVVLIDDAVRGVM